MLLIKKLNSGTSKTEFVNDIAHCSFVYVDTIYISTFVYKDKNP